MNYIYHNGRFLNANEPCIELSNRGFRYADGFFESIRVVNGKPVFFANHFTRIIEAMKTFKFETPVGFSQEGLRAEVQALIEKNEIHEGGRARITFTRKSEGFYSPESNDMEYIIEANSKVDNQFTLNESGIVVDLYPTMKKQINKFSSFKNLNCQIYVHASIFAREKMLDDVLIQNENMGIIESTVSNIFLVSNGVLYTPGVVEGCVGGTMRMTVVNLALQNNIKVYECNLTPQNLLAADEIFLTNAITGVKWVSSYRTKRYFNNTAKKIISLINDLAQLD